uniref:Gypsy retrotransposon integrase-like protein 1 n=1 Tax=Astyanax mexicanus TaxID=7994 RepID=A0A3B1KC70_ASTMX
MLDSGSMACTMNEFAERTLLDAGAVTELDRFSCDVTLVGVGGRRVSPKSAFSVEMEVYGCKMIVPTLVVEGQHDELILGTNVIKHILRESKKCDSYWRAVSKPRCPDPETEQFLSMLAGLNRWSGKNVPDKIGTVKCNSATYLEPGQEYLVWGKLPKTTSVSPGSAVMTECTSSHSVPRGIMVARVITPLWGDRWVPLRIMNISDKPVLLRRNAKLADVFPCVAVEDFELTSCPQSIPPSHAAPNQAKGRVSSEEKLASLGLDKVDLSLCDVSEECRTELSDLIVQYEDIFSRHHLDCGKAEGFVHRIHLTDQKPFRLPYRRVPPSQYQKLRQVLNEMEEKEIIEKSTSEYASPLVLVWKKNGELRLCTDFRWLNKRTLKDAHPLPHQADCLAALGGNSLFSTMDLTSGFYNMPLHEDDRKYSAFTTPMGLYQYCRLPQGLSNSPGSFMRMMTAIFGDQNFLSLLCYLDDLLIFAPDERTALERLEMVFNRLRGHNLKLAPKKCHFLRKSVKFLGHIIDKRGVSTDPSKVDSVSNMSKADLMEADGVTPSEKRIRSFLGMLNYYQHFIPNYSSLAKPLFSLLTGQKRKVKGRKVYKSAVTSRKLSSCDWTSDHDRSVDELKAALVNSVVLAHPDFSRPFLLSTDASLDGLGAVLSQVQEGETRARPIAFASKTLTRSQRNYPAHRLEFLALKWSVCDKFSHWLKGHEFTVWTDNNPLTHIMTKPKLDCCEQRWVSKLACYTFDIKYVPGPQNVVADALSRVPFIKSRVSYRLLHEPFETLLSEVRGMSDSLVEETFRSSNESTSQACSRNNQKITSVHQAQSVFNLSQSVSAQEVSAIFDSHNEWELGARTRGVDMVHHLPQLVPDGMDNLPVFSARELRDAQCQDRTLSRVLFYVERNRRPSRRERSKETVPVLRILKHWEKLVLHNGILYRISRDQMSKVRRHQYVVPESLKDKVLKGVHESAGHQGQSRTLSIARQRFFWLHMDRDVRDHVRHCQRCIVSKVLEPDGRAPLESIVTSRPLELVCIDFWSAEDLHNKSVDVLVITDHFTRLSQAFVCKDQSAKQVAKVLWDRYFCIYGFPERIHSDQGPSFESELIVELLKLSGIRKSHTTPYHPMGNGSVERFNRTLGNMIRALTPEAKLNWPRHLQTLTFMYNCTINETTGYAPFFLMYGRIPRLPVDILFKNVLNDPDISSYDRYVAGLAEDLKKAMLIAQEHANKEQNRQARLYNRRVKGATIEVGDRVLVANRRERGKRKVADRWESTVYTVTDKNAGTHTYKIRNTLTGLERIVHRNLLMLVNFLPVQDVPAASSPASFVSSEHPSISDDCTVMPHDHSHAELENCSSVSSDRTEVDHVQDEHTDSDRSVQTMDVSTVQDRADINASPVPAQSDPEARTREWITQLPINGQPTNACDSSTVSPLTGLTNQAPPNSEIDNSDSVPFSPRYDCETTQDCTSLSGPECPPVASAQSVSSRDSQHTNVSISNDQIQHSDTINQLRTRLGRVIRPVNKLLYTMSRQKVINNLW